MQMVWSCIVIWGMKGKVIWLAWTLYIPLYLNSAKGGMEMNELLSGAEGEGSCLASYIVLACL